MGEMSLDEALASIGMTRSELDDIVDAAFEPFPHRPNVKKPQPTNLILFPGAAVPPEMVQDAVDTAEATPGGDSSEDRDYSLGPDLASRRLSNLNASRKQLSLPFPN